MIRPILFSIDDLTSILKDYLKVDDMPEDAKPLTLRLNKQEGNKLGVVFDSDSWKQGMAPMEVRFDIARTYGGFNK